MEDDKQMDRFFRGLVAGIAGGVLMNVWDLTTYYLLGLPILRYLDWASVILFGDLPQTHFQAGYALIVQILWVGLLGVVFAYALPQTTSRGYLLKGAFYGIILGFFVYAIPVLLETQYLSDFTTATVLANHSGGLLWGLTLAQTLRRLESNPRAET
ncbi:MAG: hypothetical protein AB1500_05465 [Bacillota bacterium]